jgi:hypothetical protein
MSTTLRLSEAEDTKDITQMKHTASSTGSFSDHRACRLKASPNSCRLPACSRLSARVSGSNRDYGYTHTHVQEWIRLLLEATSLPPSSFHCC